MKRNNMKPGIPCMGNAAMAEAMRGLRRSSAASPHVPRARKGTRAAHRAAALREWGW